MKYVWAAFFLFWIVTGVLVAGALVISLVQKF